jgi:hypothetical protein
VSLAGLALAGCGGGGSSNNDDSSGLAGTYRIAEVGTASEGTAPCPRTIDIGDDMGLVGSCGSNDTFELRRDGQFRGESSASGDEPVTLVGTWSSSDDDRTVTVRATEARFDSNGNGQSESDERLELDPPTILSCAVLQRSETRLVLDVTVSGLYESGRELEFRTVLTRR